MRKLLSTRVLAIGASSLGLCSLGFGDGRIQWRNAGVTVAPDPTERLLGLQETLAAGERHVVLRFDALPTIETRAELSAAGIQLQTWLGNNGYFAAIRAAGADLAAIERITSRFSSQRVDAAWKMHPMLAAGTLPEWAVVPPPRTASTSGIAAAKESWIAAYVSFHPDVSLADGLAKVAQHQAVVISRLETVNGFVIELPFAAIPALAASDELMYVEPALPPLLGTNDSNRAITEANIVQTAPYGLTGQGVNVMVYDAGFAMATHVDFQGRLTVRDASGLSTHATHVSGTIGGAGIGNAAFKGMAPGVTIQSYGYEQVGGLHQGFLYTDPGDLEADYGNAINVHGAVIANNSIGTNTASNGFPCSWEGDYGLTSAVIDAVVRGSLGAPMRIVWANGNERSSGRCGTTYHTTAPPACAKNHITVGALNSNNDSITAFTSWGPTDDGRLKPDISAPGCQSTGDLGVTSCSTTSTTSYTTFCGTSMASPTVCGLSSLLLQDFRVQFPARPDPLNSTLKTLLAHNAQDIDAAGPDYKSGYGSVRIQRTVDFMRTGQFVEEPISQGGVYRTTLVVPPGATELKVTLAWDDPPAAPNVVGTIVNDLDIVVFDPSGTRHFPWTLGGLANPAAPAVKTSEDHVNNIEQVQVDAPVAGAWVVEIRGFNVPVGPQTFSACFSPSATRDCNGNGVDDSQDIANGTSQDCNLNSLPDECESAADCNNNGVRDFCDIYAGTSLDRNNNRVPDECDPDCNGNGTPDDWDISTGLSLDCNTNLQPDECDIAGGVSQDCNGNSIPDECDVDCNNNNVPDSCDIANGTSQDCNGNGIPDECGTDCNNNGIADECDIANGTSQDCNQNAIPDECESAADCNSNGVRDFCDIYTGSSTDVNSNAIPDDCEPDCNSNEIPDAWDISTGFSRDCDTNQQPDECDIAGGAAQDCNGNTIPDLCDIASGVADDCNGNGVPDSCDVLAGTEPDCNGNAIPDGCEVGDGTAPDCNSNGIPDSCDIASGFSQDCNNNGIPDSCESDCNQNGIADECDIANGTSQDANSDGYPDECIRLYVNDNASGNGSGASWENAMTSLNAAIDEANLNLGVREIWIAAGTYRPNSNAAFVVRPGLALVGGFAGTETSVDQRNVSANRTTVGPAGIGGVRHVITLNSAAAGVAVDGLTIVNGFGVNADTGGGIFIVGGSPTVRNCTLQGNWSGSGGGAFVQNAGATFVDCRFDGNISQTGNGGGISTSGNGALTLTRCVFVNNYCRESGGGHGLGGGVYNAAGFALSVDGCTFDTNTAFNIARVLRAEGGGLANASNNTNVRNSYFIRNAATVGGGLSSAVPMTLVNCVFTGNRVTDPNDTAFDAGEGGGIFAEPGINMTLRDCTVAANWAEKKAAGVSADGFFYNCIFYYNVAQVIPPDSPEPLVDQQFQGDVEIEYCDIAGLLDGGPPDPNFPGSIESSPQFVTAPNMTNAGSFTPGDLHLRQNSPCVDSGNNALVPAGVATDIDGRPRRFDDPVAPNTGLGAPPHVDMGAYERAPLPCIGDINGDRIVDLGDLTVLLAHFGTVSGATPADGDLDNDGDVDLSDLSALLGRFGTVCP